ncbi:MAG: hypothetical protein NVS1B4_24960 [Gemmatimonadaceae bacterium]
MGSSTNALQQRRPVRWTLRVAVDVSVFPFNVALPPVPVVFNSVSPAYSTPAVVAILGSAQFSVGDIGTQRIDVDLASVRLGKTALATVTGRYVATLGDVNRDGIPDLVLTFKTDDLVTNGDLLTSVTTPQSLSLTGTHTDGRRFAGDANITVVVWSAPFP